ncbi:MAG: hypothetical protein ABIZ80_01725 [Bryobacteraceae bacterium]
MFIRFLFAGIALCTLLAADTIYLRDGRTVRGTYLGGNSRQVRMEVSGRVDSFDVSEVSRIEFQASAPVAAERDRDRDRNQEPERPRLLRPSSAEVAAANSPDSTVDIPAGTVLTVRMIDAVDSEVNQLGQTFQASIDEPVVVSGQTVVTRGTDVVVKLVDDKQSGKISGRTELTLALVSMRVNGRSVDVTTEGVVSASESRSSKSGKVIGGTAAVGAIIGAIAGGGRGAAIGAASGAGAGTAVQVLTKGQHVKIPSETRLSFTLRNAARI